MGSPLKVGVAGLGTVGVSLVRLLDGQRESLAARCGRQIEIVAVSARSKDRNRGIEIGRFRWFDDPVALANDPEIDVFVELMGGAGDPAKAAIEAALKNRKAVVTANKALLAAHGVAIAEQAERAGVPLGFEAAVAGGIPIVAGRPRRKRVQPRVRHPQRDLQLHPHADGARATGFRLLSEGRAAAGLCGSRPVLRYRRS
jgi:homoserine dehydrogenase